MKELVSNFNPAQGQNGYEHFPRKLTVQETELLFSVLPENKPGYKSYREKLGGLFVIGKGRFGGGNLILGKEEDKPDNTLGSSPVFAIGSVKCESCEVDITVHEEEEDKIEIDISSIDGNEPEGDLRVVGGWSYSDWIPGEPAPGDGSEVREIEIVNGSYLLAVAPGHKMLWLYEADGGINHVIPVSNFYSNLMMVRGIKKHEKVSNPSLFFKELSGFTDNDLTAAFILYNKNMRRFSIDNLYERATVKEEKKSFIKNFLRRG